MQNGQNGRIPRLFADRAEAGRCLGQRLQPLREADPVVLGLTHGGVPVAFEVARALGAPLDILVTSRMNAPMQPGRAVGAVGEDGAYLARPRALEGGQIGPNELLGLRHRETDRVHRQVERLRRYRAPEPLVGRTVVIVDDGVVTGLSARVAAEVVRGRGAGRIVLAVPVARSGALTRVRAGVDGVRILSVPDDFRALGKWYQDFRQVTEDDVVALLRAAEGGFGAGAESVALRRRPPDPPSQEISLPVPGATLSGRLTVPVGARGLIISGQDSCCDRYASRNRVIARALNDAGLATLLLDLVTPVEERQGDLLLAIGTLAGRLERVTEQLGPDYGPVGYLANGLGAAAALEAASGPAARVAAVVSLSGRPDLVARLGAVRAPTLMLVGGADSALVRLNRQALSRLTGGSRLVTIPGARRLFREPGDLEAVLAQILDWFRLLGVPAPGTPGRPGGLDRPGGPGVPGADDSSSESGPWTLTPTAG